LFTSTPAQAQTTLTLEGAMKRAQGETADARALAATIAASDARVQQAQSGFWPTVDVSESVQRGNQPVFAFSSLLSQRRFTAANFAIPALNHPDPVTNTRTAVVLEQPVFDAGLIRLGVQAAKLDREVAIAVRMPRIRISPSGRRRHSCACCSWRRWFEPRMLPSQQPRAIVNALVHAATSAS
jgi:outer membrane protein TolC